MVTTFAALLVALLLGLELLTVVLFIVRTHRTENWQLKELEYRQAYLDVLMEIRRLQSRGW